MEFIFDCPHCRRQLAAHDSSRGQTVTCPACQQPLVIPTPPPASPKAAQQDDVVEVMEEFHPPSSPLPPLANRMAMGPMPPPAMPSPARPRPGDIGDTGMPASRSSRRPDPIRLHRHEYAPMQNVTRALVVGAVVIFCLLLAGVIYLVGKPPGGTSAIASTAQHNQPSATNAATQVELTRLTSEEQQELTRLTLQTFALLSEDKRQAVSLIYGKLNQKQPVTSEQLQLFNALFREGVLKLPPENQQRLRQLFAKTVAAGP